MGLIKVRKGRGRRVQHDRHPTMEKGGLGTKVSFSYQLSTFSQRAASATTATDSGRAPGGSGCLPRWSKPAPKLLAFR
ncbi:hypothetical protein OIU78_029314 [Salix suchowensis]|nr:hypothetical protein OIU78_029314 [Salix suchowensis]